MHTINLPATLIIAELVPWYCFVISKLISNINSWNNNYFGALRNSIADKKKTYTDVVAWDRLIFPRLFGWAGLTNLYWFMIGLQPENTMTATILLQLCLLPWE